MNTLLLSALTALVPLMLGFVWYNPRVFGKAWIASAGLDEEKMKGANMPLIFGFVYLFAFMVALFMPHVVIHQSGLHSLVGGDPNSITDPALRAAYDMVVQGTLHNFRTFKHGAFHGTIMGVFAAIPLVGTAALFEGRGFRYIAINAGYWIVALALMGGIMCQFAA